MKTMSRMFQISLVALIFFVVPSLLTLNRAEAQGMAADYKIEVAKSSLEKGDMDRAINDFKEVLMIDPANEEAKVQLRKLGLKDNVFMAVSRTQTNSLVERVGEYREKIAMLETQKAQTERKLSEMQSQKEDISRTDLAKDFERDLLQEKIDLLTRRMPKQEQAQFKQFVADQNKVLEGFSKSIKQLQALTELPILPSVSQYLAEKIGSRNLVTYGIDTAALGSIAETYVHDILRFGVAYLEELRKQDTAELRNYSPKTA